MVLPMHHVEPSSWIAFATIALVGAITPGPNNTLVLALAAERGLPGALPAIGGVVAGSVAMLALVMLGFDAALEAYPPLRAAMGIGGGAYLVALGLLLALRGPAVRAAGGPTFDMPRTAAALFLFQFANPKGWAVMSAAVSALPSGLGIQAKLALALALAAVCAACLLAWSAAGSFLALHLENERNAAWFHGAMGVSLVLIGAQMVLS